MRILRSVADLNSFLEQNESPIGCLADTGFLYALAYKDDRLFEIANDVHDVLVERQVPIYANVISRMELIDLIFRKQVTIGCVSLFNEAIGHSVHAKIFRILKNIRDKNTSAQRTHESYKIDEGRLKKVRKNIENQYGIRDWLDFCDKYVGSMLSNEWQSLEKDLGLNFVEIMEGQSSELFNSPLFWMDMVQVMGQKGLRGPDAMVVNLFDKSKFEFLITSDSDFEQCFTDPLQETSRKAIFQL
ncbi:MAG: hypothetical protein KDD22_05135 [Bdellovibrionales bacterium]|nr:hypothetical protein [Bdellovibrionales bacterium]